MKLLKTFVVAIVRQKDWRTSPPMCVAGKQPLQNFFQWFHYTKSGSEKSRKRIKSCKI